jgi:hypothetical protein
MDVSGPLRSLISRVKLLESDLHEDKAVPERHLFLLRDLRVRVVEMEKTMSEEFDKQRRAWLDEKQTLVREARDIGEIADQLRRDNEDNASNVRRNLETALYQSEETLQDHTKVLATENQRLQEQLKHAENQLSTLRRRQGGHSPQRHGHLDEEQTREKLARLEAQHSGEVSELATQFSRFRRAQEEIVRSLEEQLEELHSVNSVGGNVSSASVFFQDQQTVFSSVQEAEDKLRRLDFKYRTKALELEAVMRYELRSRTILVLTTLSKYRALTKSTEDSSGGVARRRASSQFGGMDDSYSVLDIPVDQPRPPPPAGRSSSVFSREGPAVHSEGIAMNPQQSVTPGQSTGLLIFNI